MPILPLGNYYFLTNVISNNLSPNIKITDKEVWKFSVLAGEYEETEYDNLEYLV